MTEREALQSSLAILQQHKGFTLAGWNIGTILSSQLEGAERGAFDIRFLLTRAKVYGMEDKFKEALSQMKIRDVGREFAVEIAEEITSPRYAHLVEQGVIEKNLYQQAIGYTKQISGARAAHPGIGTPEIARLLETSDIRFAGWTQELFERLSDMKTGATSHAAHLDLGRLEETLDKGVVLQGDKFFKEWSQEALRGKLTSSALYPRNIPEPELFAELSKTAKEFDILDFEKGVEEKAISKGGTIEMVRAGTGIPEGGRVIGKMEGKIGEAAASRGLAKEAGVFKKVAGELVGKHKGLAAITLGVAALWALEPFGWFSGFDDEYNTIEGLQEGGFAGALRKTNTDFGSGWRGLPSHLGGQRIDSAILSFRGGIWDDPEAREELLSSLKVKEEEAQKHLGKFSSEDLFYANTSIIKGINQKNKDLKLVRLQRFWIDVEDADTLILYRKSAAGAIKKLFGIGGISIRLAGIDAPEVEGHTDDPLRDVRIFQNQPGGQEATEILRQKMESDPTLSLIVGTTRQTYGRYLGSVVSEGTGENISLSLLRMGAVTALPFGPSEEDIISRTEAAKAEQEAQVGRKGIWAYKRYQAMAIASQAIGRPITHNTLSRLDKTAANLNLGAYTSYLESLGTTQGQLSIEEERMARKMGRRLKKSHGSRESHKIPRRQQAYNQIEGMGHKGIAWQIRQSMTDFGSGSKFKNALSKAAEFFRGIKNIGSSGNIAKTQLEMVKVSQPGGWSISASDLNKLTPESRLGLITKTQPVSNVLPSASSAAKSKLPEPKYIDKEVIVGGKKFISQELEWNPIGTNELRKLVSNSPAGQQATFSANDIIKGKVFGGPELAEKFTGYSATSIKERIKVIKDQNKKLTQEQKEAMMSLGTSNKSGTGSGGWVPAPRLKPHAAVGEFFKGKPRDLTNPGGKVNRLISKPESSLNYIQEFIDPSFKIKTGERITTSPKIKASISHSKRVAADIMLKSKIKSKVDQMGTQATLINILKHTNTKRIHKPRVTYGKKN